ncbi:MAG: L-2-amino-thiazoline-4-carboxylic acid hydrolase [Thermomicrobiaceae bacterium]
MTNGNDVETRDPARLNKIGVLNRREIEARILEPILESMVAEFGDRARVEGVAAQTIIQIARDQGDQLARSLGGRSLPHFRESMKYWIQDNALEIDVLELNEERFDFNVTRCRYAEMYRELGMADRGALLSCNRDFALIEGFDPDTELTRTQTIMQGASHCDFRYRKKTIPDENDAETGDS